MTMILVWVVTIAVLALGVVIGVGAMVTVLALSDGVESAIREHSLRLAGNPRILILDDATSAIDAQVEEQIFARIAEEVQRRTTIVVAHRLSTVRDCDTIFMLEQGRLVAQGSYDDLLETSQKFRAMVAGAA